MVVGGNHFGGQGSAPMGGPSFNNSETCGGDRYIDRSGGRDDDASYFCRDDYPRGNDNLAPLSNSLRSKPPFGRSRSRSRDNCPPPPLIGGNHFGGQGSAPMGEPSFNNSEPCGGDRYIDRSGGRDDYPRERDNLAPLSNSSGSRLPFRRSRSRQSHYRKVPRWEIFIEQELRFGQDMGQRPTFLPS